MLYRKFIIFLCIIGGILCLLWVYDQYNPLDSILFPKCPIKTVTGLDCPGCGSQRALHYFLHGDIKTSFTQNPLLFFMLPYIVGGYYLHYHPSPSLRELKLRKTLYGYHAIYVLVILIVLFTILRNTI